MMVGMAEFLKQFQKIQGEMKKLQEEITRKEVIGSSGGGMVEVTINGRFEVVDVHIERKLLKEKDLEMLEELILAAVNDGVRKVQGVIKEKMEQLAGGLNIPGIGIPGLFG